MDFFERQREARGTTVRLVLLFTLAVLSIVAVNDAVVLILKRNATTSQQIGAVVAMSAFTLLVITLGTGWKMLALRSGGSAVAASVGAIPVDPSTADPRLRRFINVVEEMSIASGVPVPRLFVLVQEPGINAFAAGFTPADAAIAVTSGALDRLNRDELQGVIGHEFSHVLNGDMRLNVRLIGLLSGILLLGLIGLRFLQFGGGRSREAKAGPLLIVAIVLTILGFVGQFFASLIQAAVSRQREWLADASSVQFTRQTTGLAGALKKIAGLPTGSVLSEAHHEKQISHMLFGEGRRGIASLYATHPPLAKRIAALDPSFTSDQITALQKQFALASPDGMGEDLALGLVTTAPPSPLPSPSPSPSRPSPSGVAPSVARTITVEPAAVRSRVRSLTPDDIARAVQISARIPSAYRAAAAQASSAIPLVLSMLIHERADVRSRQLDTVRGLLGSTITQATAQFAEQLPTVDPSLRLAVAELAAPQLAARPPADRRAIEQALDELARADSTITLFEYCLTRLVGTYLSDMTEPAARARPGRESVTTIDGAALTLLATVAAAGNPDYSAAEHAFGAAVARLLPGRTVPYAPPGDPWQALDAGWESLNRLDWKNKRVLVEAVVAAISDDGKVTAEEAELLRTVCAVLRCPLPPLAA